MQDNVNSHATPAEARIRARTRHQAMDWSLVLASQGIQPVIEHNQQTGWALVVPSADYEASVMAIRLYRKENFGWGWQRPIFKSGPLFDWAGLAWILLTAVFFWLSESHANMRENGAMDTSACTRGEWWRLFTATQLHADLAHLATNAVFGFVLIGFVMGRYGTGVGLLAAFLAGAGGNVADWLIYPEAHRSLGASGVVTGALGLLAVQSAAYLKQNPKALKLAAGGVFGGVMLFVLLGLNPETDVVAHLGGFVSGLILGAVLSVIPKVTHEPVINLAAGFLFTALVICTWMLALANHQ
jgi:membrane associated rhomboid family serine protease